MAYMSQQRKKALVANCKKVLAKYGVKATFKVRHGSTLVCTLREGGIDFHNNWVKQIDHVGQATKFYHEVNPYWLSTNWQGVELAFLQELKDAMNGVGTDDENFDKSNIQIDYFHVGWYLSINIGEYDKPYVFNPLLCKEVA